MRGKVCKLSQARLAPTGPQVYQRYLAVWVEWLAYPAEVVQQQRRQPFAIHMQGPRLLCWCVRLLPAWFENNLSWRCSLTYWSVSLHNAISAVRLDVRVFFTPLTPGPAH